VSPLSPRRGQTLGTTVVALAICAGAAGSAHATATFVINNLDPAGVGFNDPTVATPVGGNDGTTVGRQRQVAFQFAADIWGKTLDSSVPIVVDATFGPLSCNGGLIVLGHARAQTLVASVPPNHAIPGLPPNLLLPQPLADRLAGIDLDPGVADLVATFNGGLHACDPHADWYYGLDGHAGSLADLVEIVVHELGHGLGFASAVDLTTGAFNLGLPDAFSAHLYDNSLRLSWLDMTDAQRLASMKNVRHLVWDGANVKRLAAIKLDHGAPQLALTPAVAGLDGSLGEGNFGPMIAQASVSGPLVVGSPIAGCNPLQVHVGGIFLLAGGTVCSALNQADYATRAGASALLITDPNGFSPPSSLELPPDQLTQLPIGIPVLTISRADGQRLIGAAASAPALTLSADLSRLAGADDQGRAYLYASDPVRAGSTVSHWDPLARPDLVEEPEAGYQHPHDITLEAALLHDLGWLAFCGNGRIDLGEECDDASANSDSAPDACRANCVRASCGDGITDSAEACDQGAQNGTPQSPCTSACTLEDSTGNPPGGGGCSCDTATGRSAGAIEGALLALAALVALARRDRRRRLRHR
jgi:MYXO-CTERM domain-containing protein